MEEHKTNQPINTKAIIIGMAAMFIIVHIGFHASYIHYFPNFEKFVWVHHVHGALMGTWVFLLVLQPILIHKKKFAAHRFLGKLTYFIAPAIAISMIMVAKILYHKFVDQRGFVEVFGGQSNTWMQFFLFVLFYTLAIFYKKNTFWHMRFMIATAIVVVGPGMSRIISNYFVEFKPYNTIIPLCIKTGFVTILLAIDIIKKKNWQPYFIVLSGFLFADLVYIGRYSAVWQAFGRFVVATFY